MKLKIVLIPILLLIALLSLIYVLTTSQTAQTSKNSNIITANGNEKSNGENFDSCKLINNVDIETVQGESVVEAKPSSRKNDSLLISQCFYQLKTYSKSISLEVTQLAANVPDKNKINEIWKTKFNAPPIKDDDREEEENEKEEDEKEEAKSEGKDADKQMQAVPNLGEEAFLVGNRITKTVYVLKNNSIIRISIGGADSESIKSEKLKNLAQKALKAM